MSTLPDLLPDSAPTPHVDHAAFARDGFWIFRDLIPHDQLPALRAMAEAARTVAHAESGDQAQRVPPTAYAQQVDLAPWHRLRRGVGQRAVHALLGEGFGMGYEVYAGERRPWHYPTMLFQPARHGYGIPWHRDWRDNIPLPGIREAWAAERHDPRMFTQLNWALHDDRSLWVVPGSHAREDTPAEAALLGWSAAADALYRLPPEAQEQAWLDHLRTMPGAHCVELAAGDLVIYRNSLIHTGAYSPARPRATLHDGVMTEQFYAWKARWQACEEAQAREEGQEPHRA